MSIGTFFNITSSEDRKNKIRAVMQINQPPIIAYDALLNMKETEYFKVLFTDYLIKLRKDKQEVLTNLLSASILDQNAIDIAQRELVKYKHVEMYLNEVEIVGKMAIEENNDLRKELK